MTIDHKYGSATIGNTPQRVVALGFNEQDFVMALGVLPVAVRQTISFDAAQREWLSALAPLSPSRNGTPTVPPRGRSR